MPPLAQLQSIENHIANLAGLVERIELALNALFSSSPTLGRELENLVAEAIVQSNAIRADASTTFAAAGISQEWADKAVLLDLLEDARKVLVAKQTSATLIQLRKLADVLDAGRVHHHLSRIRERLNTLRQQAAEDLRGAAGPEVQPLPGPTDTEDWLGWFWSAGNAAEQAVDDIRERFASLANFLESVIREQWEPGIVSIPEPVSSDNPVNNGSPVTPGKPADFTPDPAASTADDICSPATSTESRRSADSDRLVETSDMDVALPSAPRSNIAVDEERAIDSEAIDLVDGANESLDGHSQDRGELVTEVAPALPEEPATEWRPTSRQVDYLPPPVLHSDEASFEAFCKQHWITPEGNCEAAPWRFPGFANDLAEAVFGSLEAEQFGRARVLAAAAAELGYEGLPTPDEVELWARLWQRPREAIGLGSDGVSLLRNAAEDGQLDGGKVWKLRLCMEALCPSRELPFADDEAGELVDKTSFVSGALREMLLLLLRIGRASDHPIEEIRRVRKAASETPDDLNRILEDKRKEFHVEVRKYWSSAGGKVTRTHCRRAWDAFIAQIKPTLELLYPPTQGGKAVWDPDDIGRRINRFQRIHKDVADEWDARFRDRSTMDRRAEWFAMKAAEINELYRKTQTAVAAQKARPVSDDEMASQTEQFLAHPPSSGPFEECCRQLILRHIEFKTGAEPWTGLTSEDLLSYPALLGCVAGDLDLSPGSAGNEVIPFTSVVAPAAAGAILLQSPNLATTPNQGEKLEDRLAGLLLPLRRYDLLAAITPRLAPSDQAKVRTARNDMMADTMRLYDEVRRAWGKLGDLAYPGPPSLKKAVEEAALRLNGALANDATKPTEQLFLKGWLERIARYADRLFSHAVESFRQSASTDRHPLVAKILQALDEGRYADAVFLRSEGAVGSIQPGAARRQTVWRKLAHSQFSDPGEALKTFSQTLDSSVRSTANLSKLIEKWLPGVTGSPADDQRLRTIFADVVLSDTFGGEGEQLRGQGKSDKAHFWIPCQSVREYLARQGLNPSFLPQLARAEELVFMTPPARVSDPGLVQQTANLIAASHSNNLVAVLAPRISRDQRAALLQELRQRRQVAAVIDSLDLCRLLNISGRRINLVIGLIEVMLEQQRWTDSSPFHAHDGAQARIEMYVGRAQEAKVLATYNKYSRLFSGRKLGKSALLKFIEATYDNFRLPSGNTLRVLRIPIVGIQSDAIVINKVLSELGVRLSFQPSGVPENTVDAFLAALSEYLKVHPNDSLLVILDEADVFVEKQLEEYELHKERCLSFRIRSDAQNEMDRQGLPRIRFVFAGYRKANTRGGAWGNWGDPLLLNPLEADEAADLIAGPLARLGVDASDAAPSIAYRCGYQPAVLLRFGERLLEVFDNRFPDVADRDHVVVTPAHVAEVYQHQAIQDEIRTVVRNNFQGNDAGQAVFSATLLVFAGLTPGDALPNAPETIWGKLRELVEENPEATKAAAGIGWLTPRIVDGTGPTEVGLNEVKRHLEDFVERKLLVLVNRDDGVYRLRFPYHLSSLLVGVQDEAWAALLRLGRGTTSAMDDVRTGDPLSRLILRDLETVLRKYGDLGLHYRAAVLGSLWPESVTSPDWLANRLGFDPGRLNLPGQPRDPDRDAYLGVNASEALRILNARSPNAPPAFLVGGVDLLRWGLYAVEGGEAIEVQGQGRLSRLAIERWFGRTREFGFDGDELDQVIRMTGRIPYFTQLFDKCVQSAVGAEGGTHVSPEDFARASSKYNKGLSEYIGFLASGPDTVRLTPRELELLLMVAVVARATGFAQPVLLQDLGEDWDGQLYGDSWKKEFPTRSYPKGWSGGLDDRLAAKVVTDLGLLPHPFDQPAANALLAEDDPLVQVIVPVLTKVGG